MSYVSRGSRRITHKASLTSTMRSGLAGDGVLVSRSSLCEFSDTGLAELYSRSGVVLRDLDGSGEEGQEDTSVCGIGFEGLDDLGKVNVRIVESGDWRAPKSHSPLSEVPVRLLLDPSSRGLSLELL